MKISREQVLSDTLYWLQQLADDWEYGGAVSQDTYLLADLGFESLDVVILSAEVQERYDQVFPFTEFFAEIGEREMKDVTVGEWVDFVHAHLAEAAEQMTVEKG